MIDYPYNTTPGNRNQEQKKRKIVSLSYDDRTQRFYEVSGSFQDQKKYLNLKPIGKPEGILIRNDEDLLNLLKGSTKIKERIPGYADAYCLGEVEKVADKLYQMSIQFYQTQKSVLQRISETLNTFWNLESDKEIR